MSRIHFVGVGGVGVNALAKFARDMGFETSGSDARDSELARSVGGYVGERAEAVNGACLVVRTEAASDLHPELARARELGVPIAARQRMLGEVSSLFERSVAVAGTHGKTTTTAMLAHILLAENKKFVAMIGGESVEMSNYVNNRTELRLGDEDRRAFVARLTGGQDADYASLRSKTLASGGIFVTEACEYKRSFLELQPYVGIVTNIEHDHPDCYATPDDVRRAFDEFCARCRMTISEAYSRADAYTIELRGEGLEARLSCTAQGDIALGSKRICRMKLPIGGSYNQKNALFAIAAAYALGIGIEQSAVALERFAGVKRRFERAKDVGGARVYFDFAHHPTELACALNRAREMGDVLTVFQPHTYSRTKAYLGDFARVLGEGSGELVLLPTYAARESREAGVDVDALRDEILKLYPNKRIYSAQSFEDAREKICALAPRYDVVMMLGAGDIYDMRL